MSCLLKRLWQDEFKALRNPLPPTDNFIGPKVVNRLGISGMFSVWADAGQLINGPFMTHISIADGMILVLVTLGYKTSHKGHLFKIEIYKSFES